MVSRVEEIRAAASTGSTTLNFTKSGAGTPVCGFFRVSTAVTAASEVANAQISAGFVAGSNMRAIGTWSQDAKSGRSDTYASRSNADVLYVIDDTNALVRRATAATITDGYQITFRDSGGTPTAPPANWLVDALIIYGDEPKATVMTVTGPPSASPYQTVVSGLSHAPNLLLVLGYGSFPAATDTANVSLGFATKSPGGILQCSTSWVDIDNVLSSSVSDVRVRATAAAVQFPSEQDTLTDFIFVASFTSDGFVFQNGIGDANCSDTAVLAITLPGVPLWCGIIDTPTSTGDKDHLESKINPQAVVHALTAATLITSVATDSTASAFGVGVAAGASSIQASATTLRSADATTPSVTKAEENTKSMIIRDGDSSGTLLVQVSSVTWLPNGFRYNYGTVSTTARKVPTLVIGRPDAVLHPVDIGRLELGPPGVAAY